MNEIFLGAHITVLLTVLKITGIVAWSWWWIFAPLLVPIAVIIALSCLLLCCITWHSLIDQCKYNKSK